jgi:hypothetical protein
MLGIFYETDRGQRMGEKEGEREREREREEREIHQYQVSENPHQVPNMFTLL